MNSKLIGSKAEDIACSFLIKNGLVLITRNYHCRYGEIDLIMQDSDTLVFVEVRYRKNSTYGSVAETVNKSKQRKLIFSANYYLAHHPSDSALRFDVVALSPGQAPHWINNAFSV
jgi:putative endonuclease